MLGGLIPGASDIVGKKQFTEVMGAMGEYMEVKKFEPTEWRATGDDVLFVVHWVFTWKATGKEHTTMALVRKVVRDNMICEKYTPRNPLLPTHQDPLPPPWCTGARQHDLREVPHDRRRG